MLIHLLIICKVRACFGFLWIWNNSRYGELWESSNIILETLEIRKQPMFYCKMSGYLEIILSTNKTKIEIILVGGVNICLQLSTNFFHSFSGVLDRNLCVLWREGLGQTTARLFRRIYSGSNNKVDSWRDISI